MALNKDASHFHESKDSFLASRSKRSSNTDLIKETSDLLLTAELAERFSVILSHLSVVFGYVDHAIIIDHFKFWISIKGAALTFSAKPHPVLHLHHSTWLYYFPALQCADTYIIYNDFKSLPTKMTAAAKDLERICSFYF